MSNRLLPRVRGLGLAALVAVAACAARQHARPAACTAQTPPMPPAPRDSAGRVTVQIRETPVRPERYPFGIVVDGQLRATVRDSVEANRLPALGEGPWPRAEEIESIRIVTADSMPTPFRSAGLDHLYMFTTCQARQAP